MKFAFAVISPICQFARLLTLCSHAATMHTCFHFITKQADDLQKHYKLIKHYTSYYHHCKADLNGKKKKTGLDSMI